MSYCSGQDVDTDELADRLRTLADTIDAGDTAIHSLGAELQATTGDVATARLTLEYSSIDPDLLELPAFEARDEHDP